MRTHSRLWNHPLVLWLIPGMWIVCCGKTGLAQEPARLQAIVVPEGEEAVMETERIRVHLLEVAQAISPKGGPLTSFLFMVEHLGDDEIEVVGMTTLNFLDADGKIIPFKAGEAVSSGTANHDFRSFSNPWPVDMPEPRDPKRTKIARHWLSGGVPAQAKSILVPFARNKVSEDFRFPIRFQ